MEIKPNYNDFIPYINAFTFIVFPLDTANRLKSFSRMLVRERLIEYTAPDGNTLKRHLTKDEYCGLRNERISKETGLLLEYREARGDERPINTEKIMELIDKTMNTKIGFVDLKVIDKKLDKESKIEARGYDRNGYTPHSSEVDESDINPEWGNL